MKNRPAVTPLCRPRLLAVLYVPAVLALAPAASAHHILGLPHYSYSDNYPQTPFLGIEATAGGYGVKSVTFPGIPRPGELVRVELRVRDQTTGDTFTGLVTYSVEQRRWPFAKRVLQTAKPLTVTELEQLDPDTRFGTDEEDSDEDRKTRQYLGRVTFPEDGPFRIVVGFTSHAGEEASPFPVQVGQPGPDLLILGLAALAIGGTLAFVAIARRRRRT